jgi:predicted transcriptional regulator
VRTMSELLPESEYWCLSITARNVKEFEDPKDILLMHINNMPGIGYRELSRLTGLSNGTLTYHLSRLEKSSQIRVDRQKEKRTTRYYSINIPTQESDILRQLRNEVSRQIIKLILEHDLCTFNEIVEHLKKASSTTSWHLNRLKDAGIISVKYVDGYQLYSLINPELISDVLHKYKESFIDAVVNNYAHMVEEL